MISIAGLGAQRSIHVLREKRRELALLFSVKAENHALVWTDVAVADQPAEQTAFIEAAFRAEASLSIENVQEVAGPELIGTSPPFHGHQAMIRRESNLVTFLSAEATHPLHSGLEDGRGGPELAGVKPRI
ncbi:MAG: hypothetical protein AUH26_07220 [Candidatus Rokubacteria bacterium 13_1_40CM_69_96]|nr:MAG: hypothetical protein AUH26_07220 [Candidatus Rokubacteria bacterium 13_1_40CM_69_96]